MILLLCTHDFCTSTHISILLKWENVYLPTMIAGTSFYCNVFRGYRLLKIIYRSEEHTSELQSRGHLVCRLLLAKKKRLHGILEETGEHKCRDKRSESCED